MKFVRITTMIGHTVCFSPLLLSLLFKPSLSFCVWICFLGVGILAGGMAFLLFLCNPSDMFIWL